MKKTMIICAIALIAGLHACKWGNNLEPKHLLKYGHWRGAIITKGGELPFEFKLTMVNDSTFNATVTNGAEQIQSQNMDIMGDTLIIQFPVYESTIIAQIRGRYYDSLYGYWLRVKYDKTDSIPFVASAGGKYKFASKNSSFPKNIEGKWITEFTDANNEHYPAIGIFAQEGILLSGTFQTETGDFRYLSGIADGDSVFLSGVDAGSATLFKAAIKSDSLIVGKLYYGNEGEESWVARKGMNNILRNADSITYLNKANEKLNFSFKNTNGITVSLSDAKYNNKVVIVQILGSWCHNCLDETAFLSPFYDKYKAKGVEIIGLSFERTNMPEKALDNLVKLKNKYKVDYELLLAGTTKVESIATALPQLKKIEAYPTTIFIDKKGKVRKIHTGFSGPSTGEFYVDYVKEFTAFVEALMAE